MNEMGTAAGTAAVTGIDTAMTFRNGVRLGRNHAGRILGPLLDEAAMFTALDDSVEAAEDYFACLSEQYTALVAGLLEGLRLTAGMTVIRHGRENLTEDGERLAERATRTAHGVSEAAIAGVLHALIADGALITDDDDEGNEGGLA